MVYGSDDFNDLLKEIILSGRRHSNYDECCKHAREMSWHFYGVKPEELLNKVRPNEDPEITAYRLENYEPITKSAADKAINITSKIFNPNLYSIRWKEEGEQIADFKKYSLEYYPDYNSIVTFTKDVLLRKMLADPNAVAVVTINKIPENGSERVEPIMKVYGSSHIYHFDEDCYLIYKYTEKDTFYHFEYYDKEQWLSFFCWIDKDDKKTVRKMIEDEYAHNLGELPVWKLRGISESLDNGDIIFKSFFSSAAPYWNDAIVHESDLKASFIKHLFPQKYELSETCSYKLTWDGVSYPCRGGDIKYPNGSMSCPNCHGSGYAPIGPYGVYKYTKDKLSEAGPMGIDPVGYIIVPIDATKMLDERVDKKIQRGMWSINMDVEDEVGENQSGVAKVIDRSAQYDTLYNIASVTFDIHLQNWYYYANKLRYGVEAKSKRDGNEKVVDKNLPEINKPTHFDIGSVSELINNFKIAKESGLDPNYMQVKQIEIQSRDLTTNPDLKEFTVTLLELDPLPGMVSLDIDKNVTKGYVRKTDAIIHYNLKSFVEQALRDHSDFIKLEKDKKIEILEGYATELEKEVQPALDKALLDAQGQNAFA
jgi:hypothetical protein